MNIKLDYNKLLGLGSSKELLSKIGGGEFDPRISKSEKSAAIKAQQLNKIGGEFPREL